MSDIRTKIAEALVKVTNRWIAPNFPADWKLPEFAELDDREQRLNLDYADAALGVIGDAPAVMEPVGDDNEENDLVWRLQHPAWSHGPTGPAKLDAETCVTDMRLAATEIKRLSALQQSAASTDAPVGWQEPTDAQLSSACMSYRHDYGLLDATAQQTMKWQAKEWLIAWRKEGFGCDRDEVIERCAVVVDRANKEGPYQAIASASRIRALKGVADPRNDRQSGGPH